MSAPLPGPVEFEAFEKACQDLEKILPAFRTPSFDLPESVTERLNKIFEKYDLFIREDEGPQSGRD